MERKPSTDPIEKSFLFNLVLVKSDYQGEWSSQ